jgi:hypothetical protein
MRVGAELGEDDLGGPAAGTGDDGDQIELTPKREISARRSARSSGSGSQLGGGVQAGSRCFLVAADRAGTAIWRRTDKVIRLKSHPPPYVHERPPHIAFPIWSALSTTTTRAEKPPTLARGTGPGRSVSTRGEQTLPQPSPRLLHRHFRWSARELRDRISDDEYRPAHMYFSTRTTVRRGGPRPNQRRLPFCSLT